MIIALILSGGIGSRLQYDMPKQYIDVGGRPIISYCVETLSGCNMIDAIQIVAAEQWRNNIVQWMEKSDINRKLRGFSEPGVNRQMSVYYGLKDIGKYADENDLVLVHDAARPLLKERMIAECIRAIEGHDGVVPVLPMKDTVYVSKDGRRISGLVERSKIFAGQAPELFYFGKYLKANEALLPDKIKQINGSTEPAVMAGMNIAMINGDESNFKITTQADLKLFRSILEKDRN